MNSEKKTKLKKLIVAVAASADRTVGDARIQRAPAETWPRSAFSVGGSSGATRASATAEPRNETASTTSAYGAVRTWTSSPPRLGPATYDSARLPCISELAEM